MDERVRDGDVQLAGAMAGTGADILAVSALKNHMPTSAKMEIAVRFGKQALEGIGILPFQHEECAGEELWAVAQRIANGDPDTLYARTRELDSRVMGHDVERVIGAYARLLESEQIWPTVKTSDLLTNSLQIIREPIADGPHVARDLVASTRRPVSFASREALEQDHPAYHLGLGWLPVIAEPIRVLTETDPEQFIISATVRNAATSLMVPHGKDLAIHQYAPEQLAA